MLREVQALFVRPSNEVEFATSREVLSWLTMALKKEISAGL